MSTREHLLTVVEPTTGGDSTLSLADDTVARGGAASVVMVITDRVQRDIRDFAESEGLSWNEAETLALEQLRSHYADHLGAVRAGDTPVTVTSLGELGANVRGRLGEGITAVAVPERLLSKFSVHEFTNSTGLPVIVAPSRAA